MQYVDYQHEVPSLDVYRENKLAADQTIHEIHENTWRWYNDEHESSWGGNDWQEDTAFKGLVSRIKSKIIGVAHGGH